MRFFCVALRVVLMAAVCLVACSQLFGMHGFRRVSGLVSQPQRRSVGLSSLAIKAYEGAVAKRECRGGGCSWNEELSKGRASLASMRVGDSTQRSKMFFEKDVWERRFATWPVGSPDWKIKWSWKFNTVLEQEMRKTWEYESVMWNHACNISALSSGKVNVAVVYIDDTESYFCVEEDGSAHRVVFCLTEDVSAVMKRFQSKPGRNFFVSTEASGKYYCSLGDDREDCCMVFDGPLEVMQYVVAEIKKDIVQLEHQRDRYFELDRETLASLEMVYKN